MSSRTRIVVAGATGLVGEELLCVLAERGHADRELLPLAPGGARRNVTFAGRSLPCVEPTAATFTEGDLVFLAVDAVTAVDLARRALDAGACVVDNSSAFRADPEVPLVLPEVNGDELHREPAPRLLANPNCSTAMLLVALEPLRAAFGIARVEVATYQAVSGAGRALVDELEQSTAAALAGRAHEPRALPFAAAFNVWPHESEVAEDTLANGEEQKIVAETRRIWRAPQLPIDASCARVPTRRAHCQAVTVTLASSTTLDDVRARLAAAPGVHLHAATALGATGGDDVLVDRIRWATSELDRAPHERRRLCLWLACDQLRKGAALNAVQLAESAGWLAAGRRRAAARHAEQAP